MARRAVGARFAVVSDDDLLTLTGQTDMTRPAARKSLQNGRVVVLAD